MRTRDIPDIVEIEAQDCAKTGMAHRILRPPQPRLEQAIIIDAPLPVFSMGTKTCTGMWSVILHFKIFPVGRQIEFLMRNQINRALIFKVTLELA